MKNTIRNYIKDHQWLLLYGLFGIGTLAVNIYGYIIAARYFKLSTAKSNALAWLLSVIFAYVTNRKWVFGSSKTGIKDICRECISFVSCRVLTGIMDVFLMVILVDCLHLYDMNVKIFTNFIVIVVNLITCKNIIFKEDIIEDIVEEIELADKYVN